MSRDIFKDDNPWQGHKRKSRLPVFLTMLGLATLVPVAYVAGTTNSMDSSALITPAPTMTPITPVLPLEQEPITAPSITAEYTPSLPEPTQTEERVVSSLTCASFYSQEEAQYAYDTDSVTFGSLDNDQDGIACESIASSGVPVESADIDYGDCSDPGHDTICVNPPGQPETPQVNTDPDYGTCEAAEDAGMVVPYVRGVDPEYEFYVDRDGDGRVCGDDR